MLRDKIKDLAYWDAYISRREKTVARFYPLIFKEDRSWKDRVGFAYDIYMATFKKTVAAYSSGCTIHEMKDYFLDTIKYFNIFTNLSKEDPSYVLDEYSGGHDTYYQFLALAILLEIDNDTVKKLTMSIDSFLEYDLIWETMISALGIRRKQKADSLVWKDAYLSLWESINLPAPSNANALKKFVLSWYKNMSCTAWYDNHKSQHNTYYGYWCFEAVAIAKIFDIDDKELKTHPHYPYDLAGSNMM